jgi:hypothetical protein
MINIFIDFTDPHIKGRDLNKSCFGNLNKANFIKSFNKIHVTNLSCQRSKNLTFTVFSNFKRLSIKVVLGNKTLNLNDLLSKI